MIRRFLTDYAHWPELFEGRMRMAEIREQDGKAFTDIRIDHALLPGERRLLSETRTLPTGEYSDGIEGGRLQAVSPALETQPRRWRGSYESRV